VLTAVLVIRHSSRSERQQGTALLAIPLALVAMHFALIPFTGCSLNPARSYGAVLVGHAWDGLWIFMIAPPLGAGIAWSSYSRVVAEPAAAT
jgi:glycerol uptake facilitator-like aquaporin